MSFVTSLFLCFSIVGFAHDGGHGPKVHGSGPKGGFLSSVILADQAHLGENAKAVALAEWVLAGDQIQLFLWTPKEQKVVSDNSGSSKTKYAQSNSTKSSPSRPDRSGVDSPVVEKSFLLPEKGTMKWILLRQGQKPEVVAHEVQSGQTQFSLRLKNTKTLSAIEAILPNGASQKLVTLRQLNSAE